MSSSSSSSLLATWRAHGARPFARKSSSYDSSDDEFDQEEEENISILLAYRAVKRPKFGGSVFGRQKLWRERIEGHEKLMRSYFNENPIFPESYFRRRFRMSLNLFKHIATEVTKYDRFFEQRRNAAGELGHSTYQKVTAALRMLAYGIPADLIDDHLAMGESTSILCVKRFVVAIVNVFGSTYLRAPNAQDTARLLEINAKGFSGMLGSIDCMHWSWKNCPAAWHGQFKGYKKDATIVLEAVADQETWIWHAFFGMSGSCNDINVLQRSPLMTRLAMREGPLVEFEANGHKYNYGYFLADGIYPRMVWLLDEEYDRLHRAVHMTEKGTDLQPLKIRYHGTSDIPYDERYTEFIQPTGLLPFISLVSRGGPLMNPSALTALVDRWRPETHTFHLRAGEMAPTLQDVSMILGLPIQGEPLCMNTASDGWREQMQVLIGMAPPLPTEPKKRAPAGASFEWIRTNFGECPEEAHAPEN
ncbi:hypothetical protein QYE76_014179 [Lolium multiflorum]|uniref:Aminotransferase-like plant mobile domain-containing protein n=1 Tax=Lolium multiflorum TaxID=4521 RepID=A0AAD8U4B6_LOLMU|nr:hypothetical protein QYE76_014179 [Lolium multiflorum]